MNILSRVTLTRYFSLLYRFFGEACKVNIFFLKENINAQSRTENLYRLTKIEISENNKFIQVDQNENFKKPMLGTIRVQFQFGIMTLNQLNFIVMCQIICF